jgi:pimeloyl-ACP methyl ester carboxylesterase
MGASTRGERMQRFAFKAKDGFPLWLTHLRADLPTSGPPILLVHGAGVRSQIFSPPEAQTLPALLAAEGFDVWLLDWRASIDLPPSQWVLDDAAVNDFPAAVSMLLEITGASEVKVVVHCQGSTSFMMAAVAGLVPEVSTVISNAVALHTIVPGLAWAKLVLATPLMARLIDHLNPQWGLYRTGFWPSTIDWLVRATHHECANSVCKHASFTYGAGFPTLWRHENLSEPTHEWLKGEFAYVPLSFFSQMRRCVQAGHLVSSGKYDELPVDFIAQPPRSDARFVFLAGEQNECFKADGMARTFDYFERHAPGRHMYQSLAGYGHLDVFIGKDAARDVFPLIIDELRR